MANSLVEGVDLINLLAFTPETARRESEGSQNAGFILDQIADDGSLGALDPVARSLRFVVALSLIDTALCGSSSDFLSSENVKRKCNQIPSKLASVGRSSRQSAIASADKNHVYEAFGDLETSAITEFDIQSEADFNAKSSEGVLVSSAPQTTNRLGNEACTSCSSGIAGLLVQRADHDYSKTEKFDDPSISYLTAEDDEIYNPYPFKPSDATNSELDFSIQHTKSGHEIATLTQTSEVPIMKAGSIAYKAKELTKKTRSDDFANASKLYPEKSAELEVFLIAKYLRNKWKSARAKLSSTLISSRTDKPDSGSGTLLIAKSHVP